MAELGWEGRMEGNVLFNDTLNTFYLRLYGIRHIMVKGIGVGSHNSKQKHFEIHIEKKSN